MDAWKAIDAVRVIRDFAERPITAEHLERILHAGRRTASARNQQDWAFIVVRDRERLRGLSDVGRYADHLAGASLAVALVTHHEEGVEGRTRMWDLGRAAQNMVLAAWELGIGSAPATVFDDELVRRTHGLPDGQDCQFLLSFGYPADRSALTRPNSRGGRLPLASIVHEECW